MMIRKAINKVMMKAPSVKPASVKPTPRIPTPVTPPKMGTGMPRIPTPVTPPKMGTGIRAYDDPKMADAYLGNVARAGGFSKPPAGLTPAQERPAPGGAGVANSTIGRTGANLLGLGGPGMKKGGKVKASSASKRADGIATKGKTRGKMV